MPELIMMPDSITLHYLSRHSRMLSGTNLGPILQIWDKTLSGVSQQDCNRAFKSRTAPEKLREGYFQLVR